MAPRAPSTRSLRSIFSFAPIRNSFAGAITAAAAGVLVSAAPPVTYHKQIEPIVLRSCAPCHRPGQPGPFPLLTYEDVRKRAGQIAAVTRRRYMPPWLPEPGHGDFD